MAGLIFKNCWAVSFPEAFSLPFIMLILFSVLTALDITAVVYPQSLLKQTYFAFAPPICEVSLNASSHSLLIQCLLQKFLVVKSRSKKVRLTHILQINVPITGMFNIYFLYLLQWSGPFLASTGLCGLINIMLSYARGLLIADIRAIVEESFDVIISTRLLITCSMKSLRSWVYIQIVYVISGFSE